ncbi:hypothetical protein HELRODRAFT_172165 [Helobdella robusta]|uniref:DUF3456 domain-containing protein n=1 Tax=Helobdella robusta TaxID=6412 RepID=T1F536_HELRO|nr:hypothetical protein HELRODRAFT_172165 [Helobdella robusta]ESO04518.1 hypothetical protein HELRODRAFT_172165 [Helobdella robusta]
MKLFVAVILLAFQYAHAANHYCSICNAKVSLGAGLTDDCFLKPVLSDCKADEHGCYASLKINTAAKTMEFKRSCTAEGKELGQSSVNGDEILMERFFSEYGSNCDNGEILFSHNSLSGAQLATFKDAVKNWERPECDFTGRI